MIVADGGTTFVHVMNAVLPIVLVALAIAVAYAFKSCSWGLPDDEDKE